VDCCINTADEKNSTAKNLVNFGQGTLPWQPSLCREMATSRHTTSLLFVLAFYNGWKYRNADCCVDIDDGLSTSAKNFGNLGQVTLP